MYSDSKIELVYSIYLVVYITYILHNLYSVQLKLYIVRIVIICTCPILHAILHNIWIV